MYYSAEMSRNLVGFRLKAHSPVKFEAGFSSSCARFTCLLRKTGSEQGGERDREEDTGLAICLPPYLRPSMGKRQPCGAPRRRTLDAPWRQGTVDEHCAAGSSAGFPVSSASTALARPSLLFAARLPPQGCGLTGWEGRRCASRKRAGR